MKRILVNYNNLSQSVLECGDCEDTDVELVLEYSTIQVSKELASIIVDELYHAYTYGYIISRAGNKEASI